MTRSKGSIGDAHNLYGTGHRRASDYMVQRIDGQLWIRPTEKAVIQRYDSWRDGYEAVEHLTAAEPAYLALAKLAPSEGEQQAYYAAYRKLKRGDTVPYYGQDRAAGVLDWCSRFGLLGLGIHGLMAVTYMQTQKQAAYSSKKRQACPAPKLAAYLCHSRGWGGGSTRSPMENPGIASISPTGYLSINSLSDYMFWFPGHRGSPPKPQSETFWRLYAEPVDEILRFALELASVAVHLRELREAIPISDGSRLALDVAIARTYLDRMLWPLRFTADPDAWMRVASPSLISTLALMMLADITARGRKHVVRCKECTNMVRLSRPADFCGPKCRNAHNSRTHRARKQRPET